jgi:hypothetical protein
MKVTFSKPYDVGCRKNNLAQQPNLNIKAARSDVSFGSAKGGVVKVFNFVDKHGFFGEFLIVDTLSLVIPRILIGLNRDKEKTGHLNYKAGFEEAGREVFSGPSMFLIPMGLFEALKHVAPASKIQKNTLSELSEAMHNVVENTSDLSTFKSKDKLSRAISGNLFDKAFGDYKLANKKALRTQFVDLLNNQSVKIVDFENLVVQINNKNKTATTLDSKALNFSKIPTSLDPKTLKVKKNSVAAEHLFKDFKHYSKDIVNKFAINDFVKGNIGESKSAAKVFLDTVEKARRTTRIGASLSSYLAVGMFLLVLPKLYLKSKVSPAMESAKRARQEAAGGTNENK